MEYKKTTAKRKRTSPSATTALHVFSFLSLSLSLSLSRCVVSFYPKGATLFGYFFFFIPSNESQVLGKTTKKKNERNKNKRKSLKERDRKRMVVIIKGEKTKELRKRRSREQPSVTHITERWDDLKKKHQTNVGTFVFVFIIITTTRLATSLFRWQRIRRKLECAAKCCDQIEVAHTTKHQQQ